MDTLLRSVKKILPAKVFAFFQPIYHFEMALLGALFYRFPSKKIKVVAVTGTKGKTSTVEFINSILEEAGFKTALAGTLRFKVGEKTVPNMYKMTMPGRFVIQKFLRDAVDAKCDWAVIEMTSEGTRQYRHKFIDLDALVFLNLAPEHIESHGSYEKYLQAKLKLAQALDASKKKRRVVIANTDDKEGKKFLEGKKAEKIPFSIDNAKPFKTSDTGVEITFGGKKINSSLPGIFTIYNILAAATFAKSQNIPLGTIKTGIEKVKEIRGRVQDIKVSGSKHPQNFRAIVDYAHTPDSLKALYEAFTPPITSGSISKRKLICVLGNTGGGRDTWKRTEMAKIAEKYCDEIILTDEDPYDDIPLSIVDEMAKAITKKTPEIILDRREAIHQALEIARQQTQNQNAVVLITGKGTDPYIMRANGTREPWNDADVAREELTKILK